MAFDPYYRWLGIPAKEQPPSHYRLLSIELFEGNPDVIETAADRQMVHLRNYQSGEHSELSQRLLNEVSAARVCLLNPEKKAQYDQRLRRQLKARQKPIPKAQPLASKEPKKPADAGLEQLFEKTGPAPSLGRKAALRSKQTQLWASAGIVAVGIVALIVVLIRAGGSSNDAPSAKGLMPVGRNGPKKRPKPATPARPPAVAAHKPETPGEDRSGQTRTPVQGETPATPAVVDPEPMPPPVEKPKRLPVPAEQERQAVASQLAEIYKLKEDRTPQECETLAAELIGLAAKSQTPAERYVLLVTAAELFGRVGEADAMVRTVDTLAEAFEVDAVDEEATLVKGLAKQAKDSAAIGAMLDAGDKVIDAAIAAEKCDVALELAEEAYKACAQGTGREHRKRAYDRRKQVQAVAASWQKLQAVLDKLKADPDDPEANLAAGRHWCFERGDWTKGLPLLVKGSDAELKKLASHELDDSPTEAEAMLTLADAWWALSGTRTGSERTALMLRAGTWYREAQPEITSTLIKAKLDKRLAAIAKLGRPIPELTLDAPPPPAIAPFEAAQAKRHQERWAKYLGIPVETTNSIGMKLVLIPPGEFEMGTAKETIERLISDAAQEAQPQWFIEHFRGEGPRHRVKLTAPRYVGAHEVTVSEFRAFVESTGFRTAAEKDPKGGSGRKADVAAMDQSPEFRWSNPGFPQTDDHPVTIVSPTDAAAFCRWLSEKEGRRYALLTEAQWEYACRAGTTTAYSFGDDMRQFPDYGWSGGNSDRSSHQVGRKKPNAWGLFDLHGNVWEWCADHHSAEYYAQSPSIDPTGPTSPGHHVIRGGSWLVGGACARSAWRQGANYPNGSANIGFRVTCEVAARPPDAVSRVPAITSLDVNADWTVKSISLDQDGDGRTDTTVPSERFIGCRVTAYQGIDTHVTFTHEGGTSPKPGNRHRVIEDNSAVTGLVNVVTVTVQFVSPITNGPGADLILLETSGNDEIEIRVADNRVVFHDFEHEQSRWATDLDRGNDLAITLQKSANNMAVESVEEMETVRLDTDGTYTQDLAGLAIDLSNFGVRMGATITTLMLTTRRGGCDPALIVGIRRSDNHR